MTRQIHEEIQKIQEKMVEQDRIGQDRIKIHSRR